MKRFYSLFFVMLLCLVGTIAHAEVYGLPASLKSQGGLSGNKVKPVAGYAGKVANGNAYYIPVGRVFIKSNATNSNSNDRSKDKDKYLTSLSYVMGLSADATSYWSIWDITFDEVTSTVTIVNEGNRDIMTPGQEYSKSSTTDAGYLYYNGDNLSGYGVGNPNKDINRNFIWTVDNTGYKFRADGSPDDEYMYFDINWVSNTVSEKQIGDHVLKSSYRTGNNRNYWSIEPVTPTAEAAMYARNVEELDGYVGGVVTLTDVDAVESLAKINQNSEEDIAAIKGGATNGAKLMAQILGDIADAGDFKQDLVPGRPFFLENMCSYRPEVYSRLAYSSENSSYRWRTYANSSIDATKPKGVFYVEKQTDGYILWIVDGNTNRYMSGTDNAVAMSTSAKDALKFDIDPIIPGIWRIRDVKNTTKRPYLTISRPSPNSTTFYVTHYELTEPSTLWKFKTYTTLEYKLKADPDGTASKCTGYTTYGQIVNSKLPQTTGVKAYLASELVWDGNEMLITMREANHSRDELNTEVYWLKSGYGYLITKPNVSKEEAAKVNENQEARIVTTNDKALAKYAEDEGVPNWLSPIANPGTVTDADWEKWFYLSYVSEKDTYTHYNGQDVKGYGIGFYRLAPGMTYARGKARISWENSFGDKSKYLDKASWKKPTGNVKGQMVFVDSEGETTDVLTIGADGSLFHEENTYFDLSGRRVAQPSKGGVYIKNGKKVLY